MSQEECVEFTNAAQLTFRGIIHHACHVSGQDKGISLICLNTGLNDMVGWHRIQVKLARFLAECGYNVLRYDDCGIGDSDGELTEESIVKVFASIETGLFSPNADVAVDFISNRFPQDKYIYLGFCGGGLTAIHSAANNNKIAGVVDIAGPITLSSGEYLAKADPWEAKKNIKKYKSKFFSLRPWINLVTGKGEYKNIFLAIKNFVKHSAKGEYKETRQSTDNESAKSINKFFFLSYSTYVTSKRPILFYYAEIDSATWEFKKYFLSNYQNTPPWRNLQCSYIEVEKANHIFSSTESQEKMKFDIANWLEQFSTRPS